MSARAALVLVLAALPTVAAEPGSPSEELLEYLGTWNGDEDWLLSDEVVAATRTPQQRNGTRPGKDAREDPASAQEQTERSK